MLRLFGAPSKTKDHQHGHCCSVLETMPLVSGLKTYPAEVVHAALVNKNSRLRSALLENSRDICSSVLLAFPHFPFFGRKHAAAFVFKAVEVRFLRSLVCARKVYQEALKTTAKRNENKKVFGARPRWCTRKVWKRHSSRKKGLKCFTLDVRFLRDLGCLQRRHGMLFR